VVSQQRLRAPRTGPPLHGVPTWFFFHRGKRPAGRPAGMALGQFEAAVAAARVRKSGPPERKAMQACRKFAPRAQAIEKN